MNEFPESHAVVFLTTSRKPTATPQKHCILPVCKANTCRNLEWIMCQHHSVVKVHPAKLTPFFRPNLASSQKDQITPGFDSGAFPTALAKTYPKPMFALLLSSVVLFYSYLGIIRYGFSQMLDLGQLGLFGVCCKSGLLELCWKGSHSQGANVSSPEWQRAEDNSNPEDNSDKKNLEISQSIATRYWCE